MATLKSIQVIIYTKIMTIIKEHTELEPLNTLNGYNSRYGCDDYIVHIGLDTSRVFFEVYEAVRCSDGSYEYIDDNNETGKYALRLDEYDKCYCRLRFSGSFKRHDHEENIYFTDDEYDKSELKRMYELYESFIVPLICKL